MVITTKVVHSKADTAHATIIMAMKVDTKIVAAIRTDRIITITVVVIVLITTITKAKKMDIKIANNKADIAHATTIMATRVGIKIVVVIIIIVKADTIITVADTTIAVATTIIKVDIIIVADTTITVADTIIVVVTDNKAVIASIVPTSIQMQNTRLKSA